MGSGVGPLPHVSLASPHTLFKIDLAMYQGTAAICNRSKSMTRGLGAVEGAAQAAPGERQERVLPARRPSCERDA